MSRYIVATKTGWKSRIWDGEIQQYVESPCENILHELRTAMLIEPDVTLGDIFNLVNDRALVNLIKNYSWCDVAAFHEEAKKPVATPSDLMYLELCKHIEIGDYENQETLSFGGFGPDKDGKMQHWGIEFVPVNEMRHLPVKLNPKVTIVYSSGEYKQEEGKAEACFSLFEVLTEIYFEISFNGSPTERNAMYGTLMDTYKVVMEAQESGELEKVVKPIPPETIQ